MISDLVAHLPNMARGGPLSFQITQEGPNGEVRELTLPVQMPRGRDSRSQSRRDTYQDPPQAVAFLAMLTSERWMEEAMMLFGFAHPDKGPKLFYARIMAKLTPAAMQQAKEEKTRREEQERKANEERKKREEAERKEREAKEAEAAAAREKKEAEEREQVAREAAEAAEAAAQAADATEQTVEPPEAQAMEGIETSAREEAQEPEEREEEPVTASERIMTTIRGEEIDVHRPRNRPGVPSCSPGGVPRGGYCGDPHCAPVRG